MIKSVTAVLLIAFAAMSCITEESISNKKREQVSLDAWIRIHRPELVNNYQEEGGYYVEILSGDMNEGLPADDNDYGSEPLMEQDTCWVFSNMTGRDMNGVVCLTRSDVLAEMCGTFSYATHYVPYMNYCGSENMGLLEGTYLAMRTELKIGEGTYKMRRGSKVRLYLPSSIAYGESGSTTEGGYEGQYSLDSSRPMILDIEVVAAIKNPSESELAMVKSYVGYEDEWVRVEKSEEDKAEEDKVEGEGNESSDDPYLTGLYYRLNFDVATQLHTKYMQPHLKGLNHPYSDTRKYADMEKLNADISKILLDRFGPGLSASERDEVTEVTKEGRANVWYVLRFLDGFVVDTNIAEIRTLVFNESDPQCEVFSYSPTDDADKSASERSAIGAWYYCIPKMHHGAYGQIITTSGYAYGSAGMSGSTTTESSSNATGYYNPYYNNYYNYYNSYYNYYSPYYDYYNYYNYYDYSTGVDAEVTTKTTIGTEIMPYTPLVFTLYVEPID